MSLPCWWRDDDAGRDHLRLHRLLDLAERRAAPLALAVVPDWLEARVVEAILACPVATVLQHGVAHRNNAVTGKKCELGGKLERATGFAELARGRSLLENAFGERFLPVLVPPWNRIDPSWLTGLKGEGYLGISTFAGDETPSDVPRWNTHLDLIDWRGDRKVKPWPTVLQALSAGLDVGGSQPFGVLSHHLDMDEAGFQTLDRVLVNVSYRKPRGWLNAADVFGRN